jgi:hypothetical protein
VQLTTTAVFDTNMNNHKRYDPAAANCLSNITGVPKK